MSQRVNFLMHGSQQVASALQHLIGLSLLTVLWESDANSRKERQHSYEEFVNSFLTTGSDF